jgi:hypothetical protein
MTPRSPMVSVTASFPPQMIQWLPRTGKEQLHQHKNIISSAPNPMATAQFSHDISDLLFPPPGIVGRFPGDDVTGLNGATAATSPVSRAEYCPLPSCC